MRASGMPRSTVRKILTTSPIFDETIGECQYVSEPIRDGERTQVADELLSVVVDQSSLFYGFLNRGKVRIGKNHVSSEFGDVRAAAHCNTNICLLQSRGIIDTISSLLVKYYQHKFSETIA